MLENYVRTDLALELKEDISEKNDIPGVCVETYEDIEYGLTKTHIRVLNQAGADVLGKPIGNYITLESPKLCSEDENIHMPFVLALHDVLKELFHGADHILVIGLGNRNITPDALGPSVVDHLYITRHLLREGLWIILWRFLHFVRVSWHRLESKQVQSFNRCAGRLVRIL